MKFIRLLHDILREIFDEAAYERFCEREHIEVGARSYARFMVDAGGRGNRKIRCC